MLAMYLHGWSCQVVRLLLDEGADHMAGRYGEPSSKSNTFQLLEEGQVSTSVRDVITVSP